jgi:hypothetical protein
MDLEETEAMNDYAGEDRQQFNQPTKASQSSSWAASELVMVGCEEPPWLALIT